MDHFKYIKGSLFAENVSIQHIADEVGTPVFIYSKATFLEHLHKIQDAYRRLDAMICYSVKACSNVHILEFMAKAQSGFDIVSGGELHRVIKANGDPSKTVYAGVGKTDREITEALRAKIAYFNVESEAELDNFIRLTKANKKLLTEPPKVALRINPDVDPKTHAYTTTGKKESKFGIDIERAQKVFCDYANNNTVNLCALHIHLGSSGHTVEPYTEAINKILDLIAKLRKSGFDIETLNIGGGYGADYVTDSSPAAADYAAAICPLLEGKKLKVILEPGASIAANAGILVTRVLYTKTGGNRKFIIVDAAMNDLIRPPLYNAFHFIWPTEPGQRFSIHQRSSNLLLDGTEVVDVVGPICENTDFFAKQRHLPPITQGELLAIFTAGAYGFSMSSNYNSRCRAAEVLTDADKFKVIRRRENYKDLTALET